MTAFSGRYLLIFVAGMLAGAVATYAAIIDHSFDREEALESRLLFLRVPKAQFQETATPEFRQTAFRDALDFLVVEARRIDPQFHKIKIILKPSATADVIVIQEGLGGKLPTAAELRRGQVSGKLLFELSGDSFSMLLGMRADSVNLKFRVESDGIHIVPKDDPDPMFTRDFAIPADLYPMRDEEDRRNRTEMLSQFRKNPRLFLVGEGIEFRDGTEAIVTDDLTRLTVRNSRLELSGIRHILRPLSPNFGREQGQSLARTATMRRRMQETVLPTVEFRKVRLDEAIKVLEKTITRRSPNGSKEVSIRVQIKQRGHPFGAMPGYVETPARPGPPFVVGLDPEPEPINVPADPGIPALPEITFVAAQIPFIDALKAIADQAQYWVYAAPDGATLVPTETVDEEHFFLPIPPDSYAKLEPIFTQFQRGKPVKKTWLTLRGNTGNVFYNQRSRMVAGASPVGTEAVVKAVENAWLEYLSAETSKRRMRR